MFRKKKLVGTYSLSTTLELEDLMRKSMMEQIVGGRALVIGRASTKVYATLQLQPATFLQLFFDRKSGVVRGSQGVVAS